MIGDLLYRGLSTWQTLTGNTTATKKFLSQTGTGTTSAAPVLEELEATDLPNTGVIPGTYENPIITVDAQGRITLAEGSFTEPCSSPWCGRTSAFCNNSVWGE